MARLYEKYRNEILPALQSELSITNTLSVPRLDKIVVSMGLGKSLENRQILDSAIQELTQITGQKPAICKARRSVSNFKLREGVPIGIKVTLRRNRMYEFLDRLVSVALPRVRDFRGVDPKGFDGQGNYNMGLNEQTVFPEISFDKIQFQQGMNVTVVTTAENDDQGHKLLEKFGIPFSTGD